jgi:pyruvate,water dikinase
MSWFQNLFLSKRRYSDEILKSIRDKFRHFQTILDKNNQVLRIMSDMEEKSQGEYLFDINYIQGCLKEINDGLNTIIEELMGLGGSSYGKLKDKFVQISNEVDSIITGNLPIERDEYTIPFDKLGKEKTFSVGSKNAQLGELKTILRLPAPDGFAISAWAYKRFVDANNLQSRISQKIESLDIKSFSDLERISHEIRGMVISGQIPEDLSSAIRKEYDSLAGRSQSDRFSLRSSAIGEDTLFSFAGQYATFLNVRGDEILERYREVIASKFTPQAIYYFLSHSLAETELAMSVGCISMINSAVAGVIYTRNPVNPDDDVLLINSVFGLGKYLVDGTLTPDSFHISRTDKSIISSSISKKPVKLTLSPEGGTIQEIVPDEQQSSPSLNPDQIRRLAEYAIKIEQHYGSPQDIEWAIGKDDKIYLLQTRPLQVVKSKAPVVFPGLNNLKFILKGGNTVCPGAGAGKVFQALSGKDLASVPEGAVLVAPNPFPGLITVMGKISAIVTQVGNVASHMATIAREYRIPTIVGVTDIDKLKPGTLVTVDATEGIIYEGIQNDLIEARRPEYDIFEDTGIYNILKRVLTHISPLNLIGYEEVGFAPEFCRTYHDITRYAHQMAMVEMFHRTIKIDGKDSIGLRLKSAIPLNVNIIYIDRDYSEFGGSKFVVEEKIGSSPMEAFWSGIKKEGWPAGPPGGDFKGFVNVLATTMSRGEQAEYSENSYAILGEDYMILSLRMGYHFSTIEAMSASDLNKNYIRMQFKEGGASLDRRIRRIKLLITLLSAIGFEQRSRGDFLDAILSYQDRQSIAEKLHLLGRMTILTKQLDMALSSDSVAQWYTDDIMKKLGLKPAGAKS